MTAKKNHNCLNHKFETFVIGVRALSLAKERNFLNKDNSQAGFGTKERKPLS